MLFVPAFAGGDAVADGADGFGVNGGFWAPFWGRGGGRGSLPLLLLIVRLPILSFRKFSGAYLERFCAGCVRSRVCRAAERRLRRISRGESAFTLGGYHFVGCERRRPCRFIFDDRRFPRSERSCRRRLFLGRLLGRRRFRRRFFRAFTDALDVQSLGTDKFY